MPRGARILLAGEEPEAWRIRSEAAAIAAGAEPIPFEIGPLSGIPAAELDEFAARAARVLKLFMLVPVIDAIGAGPELLVSVARVLPQITAASAHPILIIVDSPERSRELVSGATIILERAATSGAERSGALMMASEAAGIPVTEEEAERFAATYTLPESDIALAVGFAQALAGGETRAAGRRARAI